MKKETPSRKTKFCRYMKKNFEKDMNVDYENSHGALLVLCLLAIPVALVAGAGLVLALF